MSTITVVIPTYNEEPNIDAAYEKVKKVFDESLSGYDMQILFIDNASTDNTRDKIRTLTQNDPSVQAIFNNTNFGFSKSSVSFSPKRSQEFPALRKNLIRGGALSYVSRTSIMSPIQYLYSPPPVVTISSYSPFSSWSAVTILLSLRLRNSKKCE